MAAIQGAPDPAYVPLADDLFPWEVPPAVLAGWVAEFYTPPPPLVFSQLATGSNNFMSDFSFLEYVLFGKVMVAQRDATGSPIRRAQDVVQQARRNFLLGAHIFLPPATWLLSEPWPAAVCDTERIVAALPLAETARDIACLPAFGTIPSAGVYLLWGPALSEW